MQSVVQGWAVWDRSLLFEARTDEVGLLGGANQQGGDWWMLVVHVSGPRSLQPELYAQTVWGDIVLVRTEETRGWLVCDHTNTLVTCAVYGTQRIQSKHHWSKASRCCLDASYFLQGPNLHSQPQSISHCCLVPLSDYTACLLTTRLESLHGNGMAEWWTLAASVASPMPNITPLCHCDTLVLCIQ